MGKDENYNPTLGLGVSIVTKLVGSLPKQNGSNYHIFMVNYTILSLLGLLKEMEVAVTKTVPINRVENTPL